MRNRIVLIAATGTLVSGCVTIGQKPAHVQIHTPIVLEAQVVDILSPDNFGITPYTVVIPKRTDRNGNPLKVSASAACPKTAPPAVVDGKVKIVQTTVDDGMENYQVVCGAG